MDGSTPLDTVPQAVRDSRPSRRATFPQGSHSVTAVYDGDANYVGATSNSVEQVIGPEDTDTSLVPTANSNSLGSGCDFYCDRRRGLAQRIRSYRHRKLRGRDHSSGQLNGKRQVSLSSTTSSLSIGTHEIKALYAGTSTSVASKLLDSESSSGSSKRTRARRFPSVSPSTFGQTVMISASVSGIGTPTGTVTFKDGNSVLGTATLNGSGIATYSTGAHDDRCALDGRGVQRLCLLRLVHEHRHCGDAVPGRDHDKSEQLQCVAGSGPGRDLLRDGYICRPVLLGRRRARSPSTTGSVFIATVPVAAGQAAIAIPFSTAGQVHVVTATYLASSSFQTSVSAV